MELKSPNIFKSLEGDMSNNINAHTADYNAIIEREKNLNNNLLQFMINFSDNYSYFHNAMEDLLSSLYEVAKLSEKISSANDDYVLSELPDILKVFHNRLYTFWNVLLNMFSIVLGIQLPRNVEQLKGKLEAFPDIFKQLSKISDSIFTFDKYFEKRNEIVHQGKYEDKEFEEVYTYSMIGFFRDKESFDRKLKERKIKLIENKADVIDNICTEIFSTMIVLNSELMNQYYNYEKNFN